MAQQLEEIVVTAQKRAESMQDVPISIQALNTETLRELNVNNFRDFVQMLPTVTMAPGAGGGANAGAGFSVVYMRGVATGGDGQATASVPSVGMYLDEQPITTVQGNLDVHMYDIARVEALAGPQGTLFGASSQAGTIRIITNKPDPAAFDAGYGVEANVVDGDDAGYKAEGFVNVPLGERAAIRLVGWYRDDAGWVDNVRAERTFPGAVDDPDDDITINNDGFTGENYNTAETYGARGALLVNVNEDWSITPSFMIQNQYTDGSFGDDLNDSFASGDNSVAHFTEEYTDDEWWQAGLVIEGSIGSFDVTYAGNYLDRQVEASFDYTDYSLYYDNYYTTGYFASLFFDNAGERIAPRHRYYNNDEYSKQSHELRVASPQDRRVRGLLGFFWQEQKHDFWQPFVAEGLASIMWPNQGASPQYADMIYLNSMDRKDTDEAVFASVSFDLTEKLELTGGIRFFKAETSVEGFFGYGLGFSPGRVPGTAPDDDPDDPDEPGDPDNGGSGANAGEFEPPLDFGWSKNGEWRCPSQEDFRDAPCKNVDRSVDGDDYVGRINLNYKWTDDVLVYATWSEGFRPGGINRNPFVEDYIPDILTNWEAGWKTQWADNSVQFNGALFFLQWDDLQRSFQGENGITTVDNAPSAEITGLEMQLQWAATDNLMLSAAAAYYDAELTSDYKEQGEVTAPDGTQLPVTPDFKGNMVARYTFPVGDLNAHLQGALTYESSRPTELTLLDNAGKGDIPSSTILDLSAGIGRDSWLVELFVKNATDEDAPFYIGAQCNPQYCGPLVSYGLRRAPTTIGLKFSQEF
jgi:outer membrane receptor protein involved in Fe transport